MLDRDVCIRNYIMGVLAFYSEKGLNLSGIGKLADSITEAVMEGDRKWHRELLTTISGIGEHNDNRV